MHPKLFTIVKVQTVLGGRALFPSYSNSPLGALIHDFFLDWLVIGWTDVIVIELWPADRALEVRGLCSWKDRLGIIKTWADFAFNLLHLVKIRRPLSLSELRFLFIVFRQYRLKVCYWYHLLMRCDFCSSCIETPFTISKIEGLLVPWSFGHRVCLGAYCSLTLRCDHAMLELFCYLRLNGRLRFLKAD